MLEIKKTIIVDESFYLNPMTSSEDKNYLEYVAKAHLTENGEIYLEGMPCFGGSHFNLISIQKDIINEQFQRKEDYMKLLSLLNKIEQILK